MEIICDSNKSHFQGMAETEIRLEGFVAGLGAEDLERERVINSSQKFEKEGRRVTVAREALGFQSCFCCCCCFGGCYI